MKHKQSVTTAVTLAAGGELVAAIAEQVLGQEVADTVGGTPLTKEMMLNMAQSGFEKNLSEKNLEV